MWEAHAKNLTFHASISVCYQISLYFTETQTIQTQNTHTLVDMGYLPRRNLHTVQVKHPNLNLWQWILTFLKRNHSCLSFLSYLYRLQSCWQSTIWAGPFQLLTVIFIAIVSYLFHIRIKLRWRGSDIPDPHRNTQVVRQGAAATDPSSHCCSSTSSNPFKLNQVSIFLSHTGRCSAAPLCLHFLGLFPSIKTHYLCWKLALPPSLTLGSAAGGEHLISSEGTERDEGRWWCPCVISHLPGRGDRASGGQGAGKHPTSRLVGCLLGDVPLGTRTARYK